MIHNKLYLLSYLILNIVATSYSSMCTTEDARRIIYECNLVLEVCCLEGCCPRFSHAHIWLFAACLSFIFSICTFCCWLLCCKKNLRHLRTNQRARTHEDRGESPLTISIPETRNVVARVETQSNPDPVTPPPSYEEATRMR